MSKLCAKVVTSNVHKMLQTLIKCDRCPTRVRSVTTAPKMIYIGVPMSEAGPSPSARVVDASGAPVANATVLHQRVCAATAKVKVLLLVLTPWHDALVASWQVVAFAVANLTAIFPPLSDQALVCTRRLVCWCVWCVLGEGLVAPDLAV